LHLEPVAKSSNLGVEILYGVTLPPARRRTRWAYLIDCV
jgi:hypothetical protein